MKSLLIILIAFYINSCKEPTLNKEVRTLDFGEFSIVTPKFWKKIKLKSIDSYAGGIAIDETDTLYFDLGRYSNDLSEYVELKMEDGKTYYIDAYDTAQNVTLYDSTNKDKVVKSKITWETINGRRAKLLTPIKSGIGTTGIYIDSLRTDTLTFYKFNFYGTNLKSKNEILTLTAIRTIKFKY
jgi:hypothetical protein